MSRIGKIPVTVPSGVRVNIENSLLKVEGKIGMLQYAFPSEVTVDYADDKITVNPSNSTSDSKAKWGLVRSLIFNMVKGVSEGWARNLEIVGVGYRASVVDGLLVLSLGYSHDIMYAIPSGVDIKCDKPTLISISGCDKQLVGQIAAEVRQFRKPEPYKGKGIKYSDEIIRRKDGKKK